MLLLATVADAETMKGKENVYSLQLSCVTAQRHIIIACRSEWQQLLVTRREKLILKFKNYAL